VKKSFKLVTLLFIGTIFIISQSRLVGASDRQPGKINTVPTFECISIYFSAAQKGDCQVFYKSTDENTWHQALDMVYGEREQEYRGSIVRLFPNTTYNIKLLYKGEEFFTETTTLSEEWEVGKINTVNSRPDPIQITESGTPESWHLITPPDSTRTVIDVRNAQDHTMVIDADFVIVRGLELKNAARHGILIKEGRHHIVIEDCHITVWGRIGGSKSFGNEGNMDSGIYAESGAGNLIIQHNLINNPRGCANDWDSGHPGGPQAISLNNSSGGNVIRYNDLLTSPDHSFNDIIGGSSNYSYAGSPNRDSDIYGNILRGCHDDAIESEGANMNVRIWGNYIHDAFQCIATASTSKGPLYIFRNVFGESRQSRAILGGSMIKTGSRGEFSGGRKYVFHNTAFQPDGPVHVFSGHADANCVTRNNIFHCLGRLASSKPVDIDGDYDYDLFTGMDLGNAKEPHRVNGTPDFIESYYLEFFPTSTVSSIIWGKVPVKTGNTEYILTDPVLDMSNPVIDAGVFLPNFNDDFAGKGPDLGAFETERPPLKYGRHANGGEWAPWEKY